MWELLLPDAKKFLNITDIEADGLIKLLLQYVEDYIFASFGVAIEQRTIIEYPTSDFGVSVIYTNSGIIQSVIEFLVDNVDNTTNLTTYSFFKNNSIKLTKNSPILLSPASEYKLTYIVGYNDPDKIPRGLKGAFFNIVKKIYIDVTKNTDSYTAISTGVKESVKLIDSIPLIALQTLQSYRVYKL